MTILFLTWVAVFYGPIQMDSVPFAFDTKAQCEQRLIQYQRNGWLVLSGAKVRCERGR